MEFLALSTGYRCCPAPLGSLVLQSVMCFQHSSRVKSQNLWTCLLMQKASVWRSFTDIWEVCMVMIS